jgi:hypothetical protein
MLGFVQHRLVGSDNNNDDDNNYNNNIM